MTRSGDGRESTTHERNAGTGERDAHHGLTRPVLRRVLASAAELQRVLPDAVLVGGASAALWAGHRDSFDHDHVLEGLAKRFDIVLEAIESTEGWVTNRVTPGKIILGELGGIETGIRQLMRRRPLEVVELELSPGTTVRVPTPDETLRIKAYLVVRRNQTRDYLDVAALSDRTGIPHAGHVLAAIDDYYADQRGHAARGVATQLARQLAEPTPVDVRVTKQLRSYRGLAPQWTDWAAVTRVCRAVALAMVETE